jgi:hypothetical protein
LEYAHDPSGQAKELVNLLTKIRDYLREPRYASKGTVTRELIDSLTGSGGA